MPLLRYMGTNHFKIDKKWIWMWQTLIIQKTNINDIFYVKLGKKYYKKKI